MIRRLILRRLFAYRLRRVLREIGPINFESADMWRSSDILSPRGPRDPNVVGKLGLDK